MANLDNFMDTSPVAPLAPRMVNGAQMQPALNAVDNSAKKYSMRTSIEKSEAMLINTDDSKVNAKCRPTVSLGGQTLVRKLTILGVTIDSQLRFHIQTTNSIFKLRSRIAWDCDENTLRCLYTVYVHPLAMYAAGVWLPFAAKTNVSKLAAANCAEPESSGRLADPTPSPLVAKLVFHLSGRWMRDAAAA